MNMRQYIRYLPVKNVWMCVMVMVLSHMPLAAQVDSVAMETGKDSIMDDASAYDVVTRVHLLEANVSYFRPVGVFRDKVNRNHLWGLTLVYLHQVKKERPFFLGGEVMYQQLSSAQRTYTLAVESEFVDVDGSASSNVLAGNVIGRFYTRSIWKVEPYLEGNFGMKWFFTTFNEVGTFSDQSTYDNGGIEQGSVALGYGAGGGINIAVSTQTYFNLRINYSTAVSTRYLAPLPDDPDVFPLLPLDAFEEVRSVSDQWRFDLGFTFLIF